MLLQQGKLQKDIGRSLDRLATVSKEKKASASIPAFFYSASLLNNYAKLKGSDNVKPHFFQSFKNLIEEFGKQDFLPITKNNQGILDEILEIVDSELFIDCLRPDIKSRRHMFEQLDETGGVFVDKHNIQSKTQDTKALFQAKFNNKPSKSQPSIDKSLQFMNQFDQLWQSIERTYHEHNIDEAYKLSLEFIQKISKKAPIPSNKQELLENIARQYTAMIDYYSQFDKGEWQFDKQENGISLQYKVYEEEKMIAIRITGEFDIPLQPFLSVICEIDLMGDYVPFCYDCKQLKVLSRNERIGTSKIYIPLLTDRETYFYAVGYDRKNVTGGIFLYSKTINQDYDFQKKIGYDVPKETDFVRLEYKFFIVEYLPLTKQRAKIRLSSKIDMKMNFLPLFILNKSARIFAFDYFKNILKIGKTYQGSPWQKKATERPDIYEFFIKKIDEFFEM